MSFSCLPPPTPPPRWSEGHLCPVCLHPLPLCPRSSPLPPSASLPPALPLFLTLRPSASHPTLFLSPAPPSSSRSAPLPVPCCQRRLPAAARHCPSEMTISRRRRPRDAPVAPFLRAPRTTMAGCALPAAWDRARRWRHDSAGDGCVTPEVAGRKGAGWQRGADETQRARPPGRVFRPPDQLGDLAADCSESGVHKCLGGFEHAAEGRVCERPAHVTAAASELCYTADCTTKYL